ncbi:MAG: LLM class flavin-dependent oxidoreductase [Micromonosporaceae bacterium]
MRIGVGLPNPVPGTPGDGLVEWARRAEERGFTGLATIDRIAYPTHDSLVVLAAAAGATSRIGLMTNILLAPLYSPPILAKAAASLDQISRGRLTLGLAPGGRADDFTVTGRDFDTRGADFDEALEVMHRAWRGDPIPGSKRRVTPKPVRDRKVPIMIGGSGERAIARSVQWGDGWTASGMSPDAAGAIAQQVRDAWRQSERTAEPRLAALTYYSLGADVDDDSRWYLRDYYGFLGEMADQIADSALRSEAAVRGAVRSYQGAGFTELYFVPTVGAVHQVDRLADLVL